MQSAAISSVLTDDTNQQFTGVETYSSYQRRGRWPEFLAAERLYDHLDGRKDFPRSIRLSYCGSDAWFARHSETGQVRVMSNSCHLRWCPVCAGKRKNYITHSVAAWIRKQKHPKFITLTIRHTDSPLYFQIRELYKSFTRLRRMKFFKTAVPGGVWFFQVKKSKNDNRWHPHLHCLITGDYIPIRHLKNKWRKVTTGSDIVDIRPVKDKDGAANEVARYATTPCALVKLPVDDAVEMASAIEGRKVCGTWGTGRAVSLRPPKYKEPGKWLNIGSFQMIANTRLDSVNSDQIWKCWQKNEPLCEGIDMLVTDDMIEAAIHTPKSRADPWLF